MKKQNPVHVWLDHQITQTNATPDPTLVIRVWPEQYYKISMKFLTENARKVTVMKGAAKVATQKKELEEEKAQLEKEKMRHFASRQELLKEKITAEEKLVEKYAEKESELREREAKLKEERLLLNLMHAETIKERKQVGLDYETTKEIKERLKEAETAAENAKAIFNHAEDMTAKLAEKEAHLDKLKEKLERRFDAIEGFMTGNLRVAVTKLVK